MKGKFYQGRRKENSVFVHVKDEHSAWHKPLTHVCYHSPDGFEWGYPGSGPADLALAILVDFLEEDPTEAQVYAKTGKGSPSAAVHCHLKFKDKFVAGLPKAHWRLTAEEIRKWYYSKIGALCNDCKQGMYESDGCREFAIPMKDGTMAAPIKYGEEVERSGFAEGNPRCHDCGAKKGHFHHPGCDVEECPECGGQLIGCECVASDVEEINDAEKASG